VLLTGFVSVWADDRLLAREVDEEVVTDISDPESVSESYFSRRLLFLTSGEGSSAERLLLNLRKRTSDGKTNLRKLKIDT